MKISLPLAEILSKSNAEKAFLFFDYDGTLAEFAPNPDIVLPDENLIELLQKLRGHPRVELAIVSGRRLGHIRELVPLEGVWLAGSYGVELIDPYGKEIDLLNFDELHPRLEKVKQDWESLVQDRNGFYLEDKGWSIAIHGNGSDQKAVDYVIKQANKINVPEGFVLREDGNFIELCPPEADKGRAVKFILNQKKKDKYVPIFLGDNVCDESGFEAVNEMGGTGILIAQTPRVSKADYLLADPKSVREWLGDFVNTNISWRELDEKFYSVARENQKEWTTILQS